MSLPGRGKERGGSPLSGHDADMTRRWGFSSLQAMVNRLRGAGQEESPQEHATILPSSIPASDDTVQADLLGTPSSPLRQDPPNSGDIFYPSFGGLEKIAELLDDPERQAAVERWRNARAEFRQYGPGVVTDTQGNFLYEYPAGENLVVRNPQPNGSVVEEYVMGTSEANWSKAAVDLAFRELTKNRQGGPFGVLELGFGQGFAARRAMQQLELRGGWYDAVELNGDVYEHRAKVWEEAYNANNTEMDSIVPGGGRRPPIRIYPGDALRALVTRARKIDAGEEQPADVIILDMYPILERDRGRGTHDLDLLALAILCLDPENGMIIWYPHFEGSPGGTTPEQESMVRKYFNAAHYVDIPNRRDEFPEDEYGIKPANEYPYLFDANGNPILYLPVGYARYPKLEMLKRTA